MSKKGAGGRHHPQHDKNVKHPKSCVSFAATRNSDHNLGCLARHDRMARALVCETTAKTLLLDILDALERAVSLRMVSGAGVRARASARFDSATQETEMRKQIGRANRAA
jgi:hypothetical protein